MQNRRNFYRILHVQADAPFEVIKASYRTIMQTLKYHPDLGGDHWNAALVNEAFEVLSDPTKRAEYDIVYQEHRKATAAAASVPPPPESFHETSFEKPIITELASIAMGAYKNVVRQDCPFCNAATADLGVLPNFVCSICQCPLEGFDTQEQLAWRRYADRIPANIPLVYLKTWPEIAKVGELKDVSPTGIAIIIEEKLPKNQMVLVHSDLVHCCAIVRRQEKLVEKKILLGLEFVTVSFEQSRGFFFSATV